MSSEPRQRVPKHYSEGLTQQWYIWTGMLNFSNQAKRLRGETMLALARALYRPKRTLWSDSFVWHIKKSMVFYGEGEFPGCHERPFPKLGRQGSCRHPSARQEFTECVVYLKQRLYKLLEQCIIYRLLEQRMKGYWNMRYRPWNNACRVLEQQMYRLRRTAHVYATWNNACNGLRGTVHA